MKRPQSRQSASKQKGRYKRHDALYTRAKAEGYKARSIFKLEEIDQQFKLLKPNFTVLDLGASPGSWAQYVAKILNESGAYVGIDLLPFKASLHCKSQFLQGDMFEIEHETILEEFGALTGSPVKGINVVLSDMAPNTSGIKSVDQDRSIGLCEGALYIANALLKPGGHFCVKVLEGGSMKQYVDECRKTFTEVKIKRPKGTRPGSMETYVIAMGKK